jgi:hypothetical protein
MLDSDLTVVSGVLAVNPCQSQLEYIDDKLTLYLKA